MAADAAALRQTLSLADGWRFHLGDPADASSQLRYDVRPIVIDNGDGKVADAAPEADLAHPGSAEAGLKSYILPSANHFIADPAGRHARPAGNPGADISFVRSDFDDSGWQKVRLPHDWAIAGPFIKDGPVGGMGRLPSWGIGWYRRALSLDPHLRGRSVFLDVDGAMSYATVWLNGSLVGGWPYGYNSWRLDLTPYVRFDRPNELVFRLDNPPDSSRWYPGGGLYRDVWLTTTASVHVGQWGSTVTTPSVSPERATVRLAVRIDNDGMTPADAEVRSDIYALDAQGRMVGKPVARIGPALIRLAAKGQGESVSEIVVENPRLWGPPPAQKPNLYVAVTTVLRDGKPVDRYRTLFGIRSIRFDANRGLSVNGVPVEIHGVDNHHDLGALGAAFNRRAAERQLEKLREMGVNAVRMSHNPPDPQLLDLADRMGFLVLDEIFDVWRMKKTPLDFHLIFDDWSEPDLRSMLRRDRNHPSIFLWSVGNEVGEQRTGEEGAAIARRLVGIAHEEDPSRPVTSAMNWAKPDTPLPGTLDVIGLNYQGVGVRTIPGQFEAFHRAFPNKMILSTESASALSSRGEYQFPVPGSISGPVRPGVGGDPQTHQVSAYELFAADFGSSADRVFAEEDQHPYAGGEFVWTGWDYLGEPTPYYSSRSSYSGIIDLAGFPKDRFYLYQSRWRPDLPMAHLLPHWTWPGREGKVTPVHVFTSGDEAELFVNGKSQGKQKRAPYQYRFTWDYVTYQPGELKVVTWKNGKPWASDVVRTADLPAQIAATVDRATITADGRDLAFVSIRIADKDGITAPRAADPVTFTVEGPGELVATDNGDPTNMVPFPSPVRQAFNGRALAIVRALPHRPGKIVVHANAPSLAGATISLTSVSVSGCSAQLSPCRTETAERPDR